MKTTNKTDESYFLENSVYILSTNTKKVFLQVVPVRVHNGNHACSTFALLDNGRKNTLLHDDLKRKLRLTLLWLGDSMIVRWLGGGKFTHSPEKLLFKAYESSHNFITYKYYRNVNN